MATIEQKINQVNEKFIRNSIKVDYEWLSGCVQWFIEENPTIQFDDLFAQANEQWQLSDLSDSGVPCFPEAIFTNKQIQTINGSFALQIQHLLDISESTYAQLQKLYNEEVDEPNERPQFRQNQNAPKKKRVIKLELSDGRKSVIAMEYSPIACLSTKLSPGTKLLLTGPLRCVNHILLLQPKNVKILGGEVESLLVTNAFENVLLRSLNKPLNPKPRTNYSDNVVQENVQTTKNNIIPAIPMQTTKRTATSANRIIDDFNDDDLLCDIDIDELAATAIVESTEQQPIPLTTANQTSRLATIEINDMDSNDLLSGEIDVFEAINENDFIVEPMEQLNWTPDNNLDVSMRSDDLEIIETSVNTVSSLISNEHYRFKVRGINLVTIEQLKACSDEAKCQRRFFIIKADIDAVVEAAHVSRNEWSLGVLLNDNSSSDLLQARFSSATVEKLASASPNEIRQLYLVCKTRPQVAKEIEDVLQRLTNRLEELNCFMKIEYLSNSEFPTVVELIDSAPVLERKLKEKLESER